jgi:hypothetical protein
MDAGKIAFEFFGDDHRQRRHHALPHLRFGDAQQDRPVRLDDHESIDFAGGLQRFGSPRLGTERRRRGELRQGDADQQAAGRRKARRHKGAARKNGVQAAIL